MKISFSKLARHLLLQGACWSAGAGLAQTYQVTPTDVVAGVVSADPNLLVFEVSGKLNIPTYSGSAPLSDVNFGLDLNIGGGVWQLPRIGWGAVYRYFLVQMPQATYKTTAYGSGSQCSEPGALSCTTQYLSSFDALSNWQIPSHSFYSANDFIAGSISAVNGFVPLSFTARVVTSGAAPGFPSGVGMLAFVGGIGLEVEYVTGTASAAEGQAAAASYDPAHYDIGLNAVGSQVPLPSAFYASLPAGVQAALPVPEPGTPGLLMAGGLTLLAFRRVQRKLAHQSVERFRQGL